ncbi:MAG TPA: FMN-binding protein [Candidatus Saccharimonadales bacterium]|nr:FMN-binding protein [Candidatus Saccharimonadales bacterium]
MKKFALAGVVAVAYGLYSLYGRGMGTTAVARPTSTQSSPTAAGSNAASSGSGSSSNAGTGSQATSATYKDGQYIGSAANAVYGNIQVKAIIQGGKITDVQFLQYPDDRPNSISINQQAMPVLRQEAIQAQSAQVDIVSGATDSSEAFVQSLSAALAQAHS